MGYLVAGISALFFSYCIGRRQGEYKKLAGEGRKPSLSYWTKFSKPRVIQGGKGQKQ